MEGKSARICPPSAGQPTTTFQRVVAKAEAGRGKETAAPKAQTKGRVEKVEEGRGRASRGKRAERRLQAKCTLAAPTRRRFPETIQFRLVESCM